MTTPGLDVDRVLVDFLRAHEIVAFVERPASLRDHLPAVVVTPLGDTSPWPGLLERETYAVTAYAIGADRRGAARRLAKSVPEMLWQSWLDGSGPFVHVRATRTPRALPTGGDMVGFVVDVGVTLRRAPGDPAPDTIAAAAAPDPT